VPDAPRRGDAAAFAALLALFLLSGAAGLVYQVVWTRRLVLTLGATSLAVSAVLAAFMTGLAAGSGIAGRRVDRSGRPLVVYALLELGIGLYGAVTPWLLDIAEAAYQAVLRRGDPGDIPSVLLPFALAFAILVVPTALMGATLPVLARHVTGRLGHFGRRVGLLYGTNTLGAALGVLLAGFVLIPALGITRTLLLAAAANAAVAAAAWALHRAGARALPPPSTAAPPDPASASPIRGTPDAGHGIRAPGPARLHGIVLLLAAAGGFASFLVEVAWTRILSVVLGGAVQAFSLMLATFLAGLALGGAAVGPRIDRSRDLLRLYATLAGGAAAASLLVLPLFGEIPWALIRGYAWTGDRYVLWMLFQGALCFLVMIGPAFLIGATFPVLARLHARDLGSLGRRVGDVVVANTAGGIGGALAGGLLALPWLGMERTCLLAAGIQAGCAVLAAARSPAPRSRRAVLAAGIAGATLLLLFAYPLAWPGRCAPDSAGANAQRRLEEERRIAPRWAWDPRVVAGGVHALVPDYAQSPDGSRFRAFLDARDLLFHEEGLHAVVTVTTVRGRPGSRSLQINGKTDASNLGDLPAEILLGAVPMLLHPDPRDVLVIGLGSGITTGAVCRFDEAARVDVVEIEAAVVRAARLFAPDHHDVLPDPARGHPGDPRVRVLVRDGRHVAAAATARYDVLLNQPSNPWLSGPSHLFTREHFLHLRRAMRPGGLCVQWFQAYGMTPRLALSVLRTYRGVFDHVLVLAWPAQPGNLFLLGSDRPVAFDADRLRRRLARPAVRAELARAGYPDAGGLLAALALRPEDLDRRLAGADAELAGAPLNTDDDPVVEFEAPRHLHEDLRREVLGAVFRDRVVPWAPMAGESDDLLRELRLPAHAARAHDGLGLDEGMARAAERALALDPGDDASRAAAGAACMTLWRDAPVGGKASSEARARAHLDTLLAKQPGNGLAHEGLAGLALSAGDAAAAARHAAAALEAGRRTPETLLALGGACARLGRHEEAAQAFDEAAALDPGAPRAWTGLADAFSAMGRPDRAREALERWLKQETRPGARAEAMRRLEAIPQATPGK
jgi:spermidine synthase